MKLLDPIFELNHRLWYRRYRKRAARDPRWAEIEAMRTAPSDDDGANGIRGLPFDLWIEQSKIAHALTPHTKLHHLSWWLERHPWIDRPFDTLRAFLHRGRHGWAPIDVALGIDIHLAQIISETTRWLRDHSTGHPCDLTQDEWLDILTQIADGFDDYLNERKGERFYIAMGLLVEWFGYLWN